VYCAEALTQQPELAFAAGSHSKSIHMKTNDFLALARPTILNQGFNKPGVAKPAWLVKRKQPAASGSAQAL
jgi:Ala-tRNA(Pro) deacylase